MRDYGRVAPTFWTRGSGKKLRGNPLAQVVALYLFTCPASTMIGIYHLAIPTMAHETGLTVEQAETALRDVCALDIARYDAEEELVYLPEGARYQIGERLKPGDRRVKGIASALAQFSRHPFAVDFATRYAAEFCLQLPSGNIPSQASEGPSLPSDGDEEAPSKVLPSPCGETAKPHGSQARQGKDQANTDQTHTSRADAGAHARETRPEPESSPPPSSRPGPCSLGDFSAMLRGVPALAVVTDDPMAISALHEGFVMAHKGRATIELASQAVATFIAQGVPTDRVGARKLLGRYLCNQRPERGSSPSAAAQVAPEVRAVLDVFAAEWARVKRRPFVQADGDDRHAGKLVELARGEADRHQLQPRAVVRHWAKGYLGDEDRYLGDREHPLALLPARVTSYGLPPVPKGPPAGSGGRQSASPSTPEAAPESYSPMPEDVRKAVAALGRGGLP